MVALDKAILLWVVGSTDQDFDTQAGPKAEQSSRKITARWAPHPAGVPIQSDPLGTTILRQRASDRLQGRFRREIGPYMGRQEHRGPLIDDIEGLHHMLPLAIWLGGNRAHVGCPSICQQVMGAGRSTGSRMAFLC